MHAHQPNQGKLLGHVACMGSDPSLPYGRVHLCGQATPVGDFLSLRGKEGVIVRGLVVSNSGWARTTIQVNQDAWRMPFCTLLSLALLLGLPPLESLFVGGHFAALRRSDGGMCVYSCSWKLESCAC
jgi:hypothetical protein